MIELHRYRPGAHRRPRPRLTALLRRVLVSYWRAVWEPMTDDDRIDQGTP